jgi:amino acid adenylation domain-containing protein
MTMPDCLYLQFRRAAEAHPERVAVIAPDGVRSYSELDTDVARLAAGLAEHGIGAGARLGLLLERGVDAVTALLAALRLGATFIALDAAFPAARLSEILSDSQPAFVLHHEHLAELLADWHGPAGPFAGAIGRPQDAPSPTASPGPDAMYIIYTSGSTGRPKGIIQTFRTIRNLVRWQNEETGIRFAGRVLQNASLAFDVSLQEILSTLTVGGSLVVSSQRERLDPETMIETLTRQRVNVVFLSVSTLTRLFATPERLAALPGSLTDIVTAGEQLYVGDALRDYLAANPAVRLHNHYGVSESHVVTAYTVSGADEIPARMPIGGPVAGARVRLRDPDGLAVPAGETGEVVIAGECLAIGYLNRPEEQRKRFVILDGEQHYLTGDLAFQHPSGEFEFLGRADLQLKVRGHLVEPGDVESALRRHPAITECAVDLVDVRGEPQLAAWYVALDDCTQRQLREHLAGLLPSFMVPSQLYALPTLPVGQTGKVDRAALRALTASPPAPAQTVTEQVGGQRVRQLLAILQRVLPAPDLSATTRFSDAGATSLSLVWAAEALTNELDVPVSTLDLFQFPSAAGLASELDRRSGPGSAEPGAVPGNGPVVLDEPLAVIGLAGRFAGARDVPALWQMLTAGRHGLSKQPDRGPESWWAMDADGAERPLLGLIADAYRFEPDFFGMSEHDAEWTDPQQRLLLMCAYTALESAGYPQPAGSRVGVYVGGEFPSYIANVQPEVRSSGEFLQALLGNDKDFLASRLAYRLDLTGPAVTVQTACSTGLVAVHLARQALLLGECDMALAGGVSLQFPQEAGNRPEPGLIYSPDGMTRPFDEAAAGTNTTSGVGLVVLKRLADAVAADDTILALVRGTAINNDGADKVSYTAPSVSGQARVIAAALRSAGLGPQDIDFVEAHGTATPVGDMVEVAALHEVFGGVRDHVIHLGSIKGNIGHANRAAGTAGLIKAILAMHYGVLPPTIGHDRPAPDLRLAAGPFTVTTKPTKLRTDGAPIRAGVSSLGFGGTNAHVVVEQAPSRLTALEAPGRPHLLRLTADRPGQVIALATELAAHLDSHPDIRVLDATYTRNTGSRPGKLAETVVAASREELITRLRGITSDTIQPTVPENDADVILLLPGRGPAEVSVGARLYQRYAAFRGYVDEVLAELAPANAALQRKWLADRAGQAREVAERAELLNPLLLALSRATALLLMDWGVRPRAVLGHSQGEFAAATVAGALSVRNAAMLTEERGRCEDLLAPAGGMLSAELSWAAAAAYETAAVSRAGHNSRGHVLFAGLATDIDLLQHRLAADSIEYRRLTHRRPSHTALMAGAAAEFRRTLRFVAWQDPRIPFISTVDGTQLSIDRLAEPDYWIRNLTEPVRFAEALDHAAATWDRPLFLEVGQPVGLAALAAFHLGENERCIAMPALTRKTAEEEEHLLARIGDLISIGVPIDLRRLHADDDPRRVLLPPFPFRGREYLLPGRGPAAPPARLERQSRERWMYGMTWAEVPRPAPDRRPTRWLLLGPDQGALGSLAARLPGPVHTASPAAAAWLGEDLDRRLTVCYLDTAPPERSLPCFVATYRELARSLPLDRVDLLLASQGGYRAEVDAGPTALTTTLVVATQEQPGLRVRHIDFADGPIDADLLAAEAVVGGPGQLELVVHRDGRRLVPRYRPEALPDPSSPTRFDGTCLITGGLGAVGFEVARHLGARGAKLLIVGRGDVSGGPAARRLARLTAEGIDVRYQRADVTVRAELAAAIEFGETELGPIRGAVHAAAAIGDDTFLDFLHDTTPEGLDAQMAPKLVGLALLDELLAGREMAFRCAFSSNSVWLGGLGYAAYAAANAQMASRATQLDHWQVIDWDVWDVDRNSTTVVALGRSAAAGPMPVTDCLACLDAVLASPRRRVLISVTDLAERVRLVGHLTGTDRLQPAQPALQASTPRDVARAAWQRALHSTIADDANFVSLGGDSLSAIKVALDINRALGSALSAQDMLRVADFAGLVERLDSLAAAPGPPTPDPIATSQPEHSVTSVLQERWFDMDARGYGHIDLRVRIEGPVDPELAARAVQQLCRRHAILRSRYQAGVPVMTQTLPDWRPRLDLIDLTGITGNAVSKAIYEAEGRAARRFDLTREVPFDMELVRLNEREHLLIGRMHHIAVDGWSFSVLLEDFERVYAWLEHGDDLDQLASAPQYAYYAAAERSYVEGPGICDARDYWRAHFAGAAGPTSLPASPVHAGLGQADQELGACVNVVLPPGQAAEIRAFAAARRTTMFPVLVSAFVLMLREVTGEQDLVFGTTAAGRHLPGTEDMIGVFVNPLPVRIDLAGRSAPGEVIGLVRDQLLEFHRHQRYVLADLVQHVPPFIGRDINETFHAYILLQNYPRPQRFGPRSYTVFETDDLGEEGLVQLRREHGRLMRDYELVIVERADGGLSLNHWYRSGRFTEAQVRGWSELYLAALRRILAA